MSKVKRSREMAAPARSRDRGATLQLVVCTAFLSLVVLVFSSRLEAQFTLPKLVALELFAAALGATWLYRHAGGETRALPPAVIAVAIVLGGWWSVTTATAVHPATAVWGAPGRFNGLATHLTLLFLCLLVASSRLGTADIERQMKAFVLVLVPASIYALIQFAGGDPIAWAMPVPRAASTVGNPVIFAALLGLGLPFALLFAVRAPAPPGRWTWAAVFLCLLAAAITTLSRGPLIGSAIAIFAMAAAAALERRRQWGRWTVGLGALAAVLVVLGGYLFVVEARARWGGGDPTLTGRDRQQTQAAAAQMVRTHPITGVGLENFGVAYPRYRLAENEQLMPDVIPTRVHNGYLQAAATTGVPGLMAYLIFVALVFGLLVRLSRQSADDHVRWLAVAFAAAIAGYGIQDVGGWLELPLMTGFWLVLGLGLALAGLDRPRVDASGWAHRLAMAVVAVATIVAAGLAVQATELMSIDARFRALGALAPAAEAGLESAAAAAVAAGRPAAVYLDRAGLRYATRFAETGTHGNYQQATDLFERARRLNKFDPYVPIHHLALETVALQRKTIAASALESTVGELLTLDPNNGSAHEAVARFRLAEGRAAEAAAAVGRAIQLRPWSGRYSDLQGDIERALGRRTAAIAAYRTAGGQLTVSDPTAWIAVSRKLIVMLLEDGQPAEALRTAQALLARQPGDGLGHTLLGFAHLALKDVPEARKAFGEALKINPRDQVAVQALASVTAPKD